MKVISAKEQILGEIKAAKDKNKSMRRELVDIIE